MKSIPAKKRWEQLTAAVIQLGQNQRLLEARIEALEPRRITKSNVERQSCSFCNSEMTYTIVTDSFDCRCGASFSANEDRHILREPITYDLAHQNNGH